MTKRRGRGEGGIYKRNDGLWCAQLTTGYDGQGKRKRHYVYGKTKKEVQNSLVKIQSAHSSGSLADPKRMRVAEYLNHWLEDVARPTIRYSTYLSYGGIARKHILPNIGGIQISSLQPAQIQQLYTKLEKGGASPRMRQLVHVVLRRALSQAVQLGYLQRNVCDAVKRPRAPKKNMNCFDQDQTEIFLKTAEQDRFYALYVLAIASGLRQGELLGLKWSDIDGQFASFSVQRAVYERSGKLHINEPKTAKGRRNITLPKFATEALRSHLARMKEEGIESEWVFCDSNGSLMRATNLRHRSFYRLLEQSGLPRIRFHDLRHTAATLLLSKGVHPKIVQERLGHSQISMTLDTYSHVLPTMQRDAADRLDELFPKKMLRISHFSEIGCS